MNNIIGLVCGIFAMIGWGTADFITAMAVRRSTLFQTLIWSQIFGVVIYLSIFVFFFKFPILSTETIGMVVLSGLISAVSYFGLFKGLQVGKVAIVSPVVACWSLVTVILSLVFLGETLSEWQIIGVFLAIVGVVLTSLKLRNLLSLQLTHVAEGVPYALIAMISTGVSFIILDMLVTRLSWFLPIFFTRIVLTIFLLTYTITARKKITFPGNIILWLILMSIAEAGGMLAFGIGINYQYTAVVAPISAAFPMVAILLARIFFRETLATNQKIGVVSIITGLVFLSL